MNPAKQALRELSDTELEEAQERFEAILRRRESPAALRAVKRIKAELDRREAESDVGESR